MKRKFHVAITAMWWTHREVMRARFPMIAGVLVAVVFLFVPQGREILNVMSQPSVAQTELFRAEFDITAATAGMNWGWIATFWSSALALSLTCWAFTRLLLAAKFTVPGCTMGEVPLIAERDTTRWQAGLEDACAAVLPIIFGAMPLVAIGCALLQNGQTLTLETRGSAALTWFCRLYPLLVVFGIPLLVLTVDGVQRAAEDHQQRPSNAIKWLLYSVPIALALPILVSVLCAIWLPGRRTCLEATAFFLAAFVIFGLRRARLAALLGLGILVCALWRAFTIGAGHGLLDFNLGDPQIHPWRMAEIWIGVLGGIFAITIPLVFDLEWKRHRLLGWVLLAGALYVAAVAALIISRTDLARWAGCGAVLLVGLGFWLCLLGGIQAYARKERVPWLVILGVWMALCTLTNDNHRVRTFPAGSYKTSPRLAATDGAAAETERPVDIAAAYDRWKAVPAIREELQRGASPPMFIVVTEGGGIRAAFWTATVLAALEDLAALKRPHPEHAFVDHCFAISGVSGGSVGGTLFAAMHTTNHVHPGGETLDILKEDLLSPLMSGLVCNDWLQCALPLPIRWLDRGGRFEQNLEERFSTYLDPAEANALSGPMLDLNAWRAKAPENWTPYLFLNSTNVESGNRVIFSDVKINGGSTKDFSDARDGHGLLSAGSRFDSHDLPLVTAAHNSARFPYTNPVGRLPGDERITDGGLFENSGATTGMEIARAVQRREFASGSGTKPQIVMIVVRFDDAVALPRWNLAGHFLHGLTGPVAALVSSRSARASYGFESLSSAMPTTEPSLGIEVITFTARTRRTMQPLGWQLSALAARDLYFQMPHELVEGRPRNSFASRKQPGPAPEEGFEEENVPGAQRVIDLLTAAPGVPQAVK